MTIAKDKVAYILMLDVEPTEAGTEELLSDLAIVHVPKSQRPAALSIRSKAGRSRETPWRDIDLSSFEYPKTSFKRVQEEITNLHNQYF